MAFNKLDKLVKNRMKERGFGRQVNAIEIIKITQEFFNTKFPSFTHKIQPVSFKNGMLTIASLSAPVASELKLHEKEIIDYINQKFGDKKVVERMKILL
ncbi:DciA family protein [Patescibacteria group bacterium]